MSCQKSLQESKRFSNPRWIIDELFSLFHEDYVFAGNINRKFMVIANVNI